MIGFDLSDEQRALRDMARDFAEQEIRPVIAAIDRDATWPADILAKASETGLLHQHIPAEHGGPGLGILDGALIAEEIGRGCSGIATTLGGNTLAVLSLLVAGAQHLQPRYFARLLEAPRVAAFALTEPDAGSDPSAMRTTARRSGAGWVIDGAKCFISNGSHADWYTVFARTGSREEGRRGISAFVVPREAGVAVTGHEDKLGQRSSDTASLSFDGVEIPSDHLIGEVGDGFALAMRTLDRTRAETAAVAVGVARAAFEHALQYAKEREQFGVPIIEHQMVGGMLADMATDIDAARLLTWRAAALADQGRRSTLESSHAKRFAADVAMRVTTDAVQVHGGYGFTREYPVEKLMRDAKVLQIYEGTSQIQRLVIVRELAASR